MWTFVVLSAITFWLIYKFWVSAYSHWKNRGFPYIPGRFPFGSSVRLSTLTKFQGFVTREFDEKMRSHPIYGFYLMRNPILVAQDPEIIRLVLTKDFPSFRDRTPIQRSPEEFLAHHLFNLDGDRWRALRVKLTPTFTSGKIKAMLPILLKCSEAYDKVISSRVNNIVDIKDFTASYTLDTIASCAFGLEVNSLNDKNRELKRIGCTIFKKNNIAVAMSAFLNSFPSLTKKIFIRALPQKTANFFLDLIKTTAELRKQTGWARNDFFGLLLDLKEKGTLESDAKTDEKDFKTNIEITYEFMTAQCFIFLAAGLETSSSVQSYLLYELALNPDIQERIHDEIVKVLKNHGELTYEAIKDMKYLDMAIHETMRRYPTIAVLTRCCTKAFELPSGQRIEKGDQVWVPVYSLHHNPAYFPNPEVFDPERFSDENKSNIKPFTYLPFGEGPRICIGFRFGLLQTKMGLITLLRNYRVEKVNTTTVPMKFVGSFIVTLTDGSINLQITKRNSD